MDVLTDVLRAVRLRSHVYGRFELTAPWGLRFAAGEAPVFHIVSRGSCWLELEGAGDGRGDRTGRAKGLTTATERVRGASSVAASCQFKTSGLH